MKAHYVSIETGTDTPMAQVTVLVKAKDLYQLGELDAGTPLDLQRWGTVSNEDVPIEATFKWLVREKDRLAGKLEELTGYTKSLEQRNDDMAREIEVLMSNNERLKVLAEKTGIDDKERMKLRKKFKGLSGKLKCVLNEFQMMETGL